VRRLAAALLAAAALAGVAATAAHATTWCGTASATDLLPQTVGGPSVHMIYAYPADGTDRLAQFGTTMQTDAETIDAWWRSQDPTRTPRFDSFAFSCGVQVDITDLKLPDGGATLQPLDGRFTRITTAVTAAGLALPSAIDLVYYDGPDGGGGVCGEGGTSDPSRGPAFAIVFSSGCGDEPTAVTAAHELTHALGAVIPPAPNDCPPPDDGHVCDSNRDLMYPFVDGTPLSGLTLDVGRNDYYGATGIGFDVRTSRWLRHLDEAVSPLDLLLTGAGHVTSDVPGVDCTASCGSTWDGGEAVTLTAEPQPGMRFVRWGGACAGSSTSPTCALTLAGPTSVAALFAPGTYVLTVAVTGRGKVTTVGSGTVCSARCRHAQTSFQAVRLQATPLRGWRFRRWSGACRGTRPTCSLPMTANATAAAVFVKKPAAKKQR
jgi:List-Bact-rpt repeat protein